MWRLRPDVLATALWAMIAVTVTRRRLRRDGVRAACIPAPARWLPRRAGLGVDAVVTRLAPTCIERSLVQQRWLAAAGDPRDVVIGVPTGGMVDNPAHAWVEGMAVGSDLSYVEIHRLPPP